MAENNKITDPYAPPPMYHDRSGGLVRVVLLAGLLGAAALGYVWMSGQEQTALVPEVAQEQQVADAGYQVSDTLPEATSESLPAAPAPATTPTPRRRSGPVERAPEPTPEAVAPPAQPVPAAPTPLPPSDTVG